MNMKVFSLDGKYFKAFCGLLIFSLLYILPVVLANFYYIDDLGRSLSGYTGWNGNGRPLASLLAVILSDGKPLMDVSPWIQIASVIVFAYSLILFLKKYTPEATPFKLVCIAACSYLNFFLLENLSYKYDSLGMILSLSLFLVLYALPEFFSSKKQLAASIGAVVLSLSLYQAALGSYLSLIIIEYLYFLNKQAQWKVIGKRILMRFLGAAGGSLLYKLIIIRIFVSKDGYSAEHASIVNPLSVQGLQKMAANAVAFGDLFKAYASSLRFLGVLLVLTLIIGVIYLAYTNWQQRTGSFPVKIGITLTILISPFLLLMASVISLVLLNIPVIAPRVMLSFTIFTLFIGLIIFRLSETQKVFLAVAIIALICTLSFSSYYGNLLNRQERMNSLVASYLVLDMNELETERKGKIDTLSFVGHVPKCPELLLASKKRPLFERLIPIYMNNDWYWGGQYVSHYRKHTVRLNSEKDDKAYAEANVPLRQNEFYRLYLRDGKLIVLFADN